MFLKSFDYLAVRVLSALVIAIAIALASAIANVNARAL